MKKILFAAGITIIGLSAAFAQDIKQTAPVQSAQPATQRMREGQRSISPEGAAQRRTERLEQQLGLTADQKKKVYDLFLKQSQENQGRVIQSEETDQQLKAIFTAEQNTQYETMKAERREMMQSRTPNLRSVETKSPAAVK